MLMPRKVRHRKQQRGIRELLRGTPTRGAGAAAIARNRPSVKDAVDAGPTNDA